MAEVAIVGAGVIGLAVARELGRAGLTDVVVLEREAAVARGSTSRANGGFRAQFTTRPNVEFSRFSIDELERLEAETGLCSLRQVGYLLMTGTEPGEHGLRAAYELQRSLGVPTEWLTPEGILAKAPFVRPHGLLAGTFHARDGLLDPYGVARAMGQQARAAGIRILTGAGVRTIRRTGVGFELEHALGRERASWVVNAAGPDAAEVAAMLGVEVPVEPVRRNLAFAPAPPGEPIPMCVDLDTGVLVRREGSGAYVIAYSNPDDPPGRETSVDPAFFEELAERVGNRFPFLEELPIDRSRSWAGLYPETPDHHAIIGQAPGVPGFVLCVGFGGHGIMHAPAAGRAVAELIALGRCETFDLRPLRPERFAEGDLVVEAAVL